MLERGFVVGEAARKTREHKRFVVTDAEFSESVAGDVVRQQAVAVDNRPPPECGPGAVQDDLRAE